MYDDEKPITLARHTLFIWLAIAFAFGVLTAIVYDVLMGMLE